MPTTASDTVNINKTIRVSGNNTVNVRKEAGNSATTVAFIDNRTSYTATKIRNGFYFLPAMNGWVSVAQTIVEKDNSPSSTVNVDDLIRAGDVANVVANIGASNLEQSWTLMTNEQKKVYTTYVNTEYADIKGTGEVADGLLVDNLNGIYGIPYQFPETVDPKLEGTKFGSIYAERIIARMPLLMMSPGKVDYMSSYSDGEKNVVLDALIGSADSDTTLLGQFLSKPAKYYTFKYDAPTYWHYVNGMNHACAVYLGIDDVRVNINGYSQKLKTFKWEKATNSKFDSLLISNQEYICFYADAESSIGNTFGNDTTQSQIADKVNSFSDIAREAQFLIGSQTGNKLKWLSEEGIDELNDKLSGMADMFLGGSNIFKTITKEFAVVATGGKLIFPEIWSDSTFSQSFDVKMKLRCPNPNKLNWYLDICVPLNHLLAFTMPRTPRGTSVKGEKYEPSANGYMSPFLVRAFFRGLFNCDMGIITSLNIDKGKEGSWTLDGLPTEVDVSMEIKDLYNVMAMTAEDQDVEFINNTCYLNYLATSCGISINKPDIERSVDLWLMLKENLWKDRLTGYNFWQSFKQGSVNKLYNLYQGIFKG